MVKLPTRQFQLMVPLLREKGFYEHAELREICWPAYNISQIREAKDMLLFIRNSVDKCCLINMAGQVGKPLTDVKSLAKAVLLSEYLGLTERSAEGWLDILGPFLGIFEHLDDRVIGESYGRVEVLYILKQVFEMSKTSDGRLSGDGTGLETSRKQNYEDDKKSGGYLVSIIDSREVVQAFDISGKQECQIMFKLIKEVEGDSLRLDAGFICRELTKRIDERGITPYIFPKSNTILNGSLAWKLMYLELYYDAWQWLKEYHQRSHSESFHSSLKRKNGILRKLRPTCQLGQITARIIIHNQRKQHYYKRLTSD